MERITGAAGKTATPHPSKDGINGWSPSIFSRLYYHKFDVNITVRHHGCAVSTLFFVFCLKLFVLLLFMVVGHPSSFIVSFGGEDGQLLCLTFVVLLGFVSETVMGGGNVCCYCAVLCLF